VPEIKTDVVSLKSKSITLQYLHYVTLQFQRIFKARGIERPYTYLVNSGFGNNLATRMKKNKVMHLQLRTIEKMCLLFRCTPNDLIEWIPDDSQTMDKDSP